MANPENHRSKEQGLLSPGSERMSKAERDAFKNRLDQLGDKLDKATPDDKDQPKQSQSSGLAIAMRMGSEFVVAVLIGGAMGWYLDKWLDTSPFMLFIFILFGFAAGTKNIIRVGKALEAEKKQASIAKTEDEKRL